MLKLLLILLGVNPQGLKSVWAGSSSRLPALCILTIVESVYFLLHVA